MVVPPNTHRILVECIRDVCRIRGITLTEHSEAWLLTLAHGQRRTHVFGYDFAINSAAAQLIAKDKAATSELLAASGVPAVPHDLHHHPSMAAYVPAAGSWRALNASFERHGRDVVCKRNNGTGGTDVRRARSELELSTAVHELFAKTRSLCVSPFVRVAREVRVLLLRSRALLVYEKVRPAIIGDGHQSVLDLALARVRAAQAPATEAAIVLSALSADVDPRAIPAAGEEVVLNFRHNLGQGAVPRELPASDPGSAPWISLATRAAESIGIALASVDVIEDIAGERAVLEVNSGIMVESYARSTLGGRRTAGSIYDAIVCDALQLEVPASESAVS